MKVESSILIVCIIVGLFSEINGASSSVKPTTKNTPPRTTPRTNTPPRTTPRTNTPPRTTPRTNTPPRTTPRTNTPPRTTPRTTPRPRYSYCYTCQYGFCPLPFRRNGAYVREAISPTGYCVKISDTALTNSPARRDIGTGYCVTSGCGWRFVDGANKYVCCCYGNLCNSALPTSKLNIFILFLSVSLITFIKRYF
ncbi:unnamed protein product [Adineta ricciae]|uniref:Uncharacterized protein n=1 Tax=Adineta ricciae TaxID=249248 RepID=A0A815LNG4_ADIRI|nr:unnamed protein product [Adineta ricciae]CAF1498511.1 unnamed protein product [Adineta ricciae]